MAATETGMISTQRRWQWLAVLLVAGVLVWLLGPVLTPFVVAAVLATFASAAQMVWRAAPHAARFESMISSKMPTIAFAYDGKACQLCKTLVEQKLAIALQISQRVYVMGHGSIVFEGTPEELKANAQVRKEWLEV